MGRYIARKLVSAIPILLGVLTVVFLLVRMVPGDPAEAILGEFATPQALETMREALGLNLPLHEQYFEFMSGALKGDFGRSILTRQPVTERIAEVLPFTLQLAVGALIVATLIGVPLGIYAAVNRNRPGDYAAMVTSLLGVSMPDFWIGLLLVLLFSVKLQWLPITGAGEGGGLWQTITYLLLPSITLGASMAGLIARMTRSTMLEVLDQDYIRTARAKGMGERLVIYRHALRNAVIPVITILGLNVGRLLAGTVIAEHLFVRPGLGQILLRSMQTRDYPQIQGLVALFAVVIIGVNLIVDLMYGVLDPRVRYD